MPKVTQVVTKWITPSMGFSFDDAFLVGRGTKGLSVLTCDHFCKAPAWGLLAGVGTKNFMKSWYPLYAKANLAEM